MTPLSSESLQEALQYHHDHRQQLEAIDRANDRRKSLIKLTALRLVLNKLYNDDGIADLKQKVSTHDIAMGKLKQEHAAHQKRQAQRISILLKENNQLKDRVKELEKASAPRNMLGMDSLDADFDAGVTKPAELPTFTVNNDDSDSFLSDSDSETSSVHKSRTSRRPSASSDVSTSSIKTRRVDKTKPTSDEEFASANSTLNVHKAKKVSKIKLKKVDANTRKRQLEEDEVHNYEDKHFDTTDPNITMPDTSVPTILTPVVKRVRRQFNVGSIKSTIEE